MKFLKIMAAIAFKTIAMLFVWLVAAPIGLAFYFMERKEREA